MTAIEDLLRRAEADGVTIRRAGGRLKLRGEAAAVGRWAGLLRGHKDRLLPLVPSLEPKGANRPEKGQECQPPDLDDYQADFYERAGICEYDGGQPREQAERAALGEALHTYERFGLKGLVQCCECAHFIPDPIGCGGVGSCHIEGEGTRDKYLPLYPRSRRRCANFQEKDGA